MKKTLEALVLAVLLVTAVQAQAARISDIRNTKHNLSAASTNTVRAAAGQTTEVCVFCHTPHGANSTAAAPTPLWNRATNDTLNAYTPYLSSSLDAAQIQGALDQPGGSSKLCLSCHDGTLGIGNVNVLNGANNVTINMQNTGAGGTMPGGSGETTGFTRRLGTDLTNDHPISLNYNAALAARDGELRVVDTNQQFSVSGTTVIGVRAPGFRPQLPLERTGGGGTIGQIQCGTCHDPHLRETDTTRGNQKFLRQNRFHETLTPSATLNTATDQICLGCHDKNLGTAATWVFSAHAHPNAAEETYNAAGASQRDFPAGLPVWKAGCLNCHDTHTVQGARRLLREGTDNTSIPKQGGNPALEETCYQCHSIGGAGNALTTLTQVPNIKSDFQLARRMPITSLDQGRAEVHDIASSFADVVGDLNCVTAPKCGADFVEAAADLGFNNLGNRHAECTDCHNPHRVIKGQNGVPGTLTIANTSQKAGTHRHEDATGYTHSNIISGVLRGSWGVEPSYTNASFQAMPSSFLVKRGDPGSDTLPADCQGANKAVCDGKTYVTREYQICLKCHSNYGYNDDNVYNPTTLNPTRPSLGGRPGLTPVTRTNDARAHQNYTNQAKEFQAPALHRAAQTTTAGRGQEGGAAAAYNNNNHRSWHPVMDSTGRTLAIRGGAAGSWLAPWGNVGTQTMYCSDCHGSSTGAATSVMPTGNTNTNEDGSPWGPHGSANDFLLKGLWNTTTGGNGGSDLCLKCHTGANYAGGSGGTGWATDKGDGHQVHQNKIGRMRCNWCHVAVPHGWKNMALLVNLNDVGPEAGLAVGTQVRNGTTTPYTAGPYYRNAINKVRVFRSSGTWVEGDCGSAGAPGNNASGRTWMKDSSENCANPP
jgi:hypothetical protein